MVPYIVAICGFVTSSHTDHLVLGSKSCASGLHLTRFFDDRTFSSGFKHGVASRMAFSLNAVKGDCRHDAKLFIRMHFSLQEKARREAEEAAKKQRKPGQKRKGLGGLSAEKKRLLKVCCLNIRPHL